MQATNSSLESIFLNDRDSAVLEAAEQFAKWTLPTVFTEDNSGNDGRRTSLRRDYQSTGALLVNTAATKVTNALFPQGSPFFRFVDSDEMTSIINSVGKGSNVASIKSSMELSASSLVFSQDNFAAKTRATKLLMVTGNALEFFNNQTGKSHVFSVRDFSVKRDGSGQVLRGVLKERISAADLPEAFRAAHAPNKEDHEDITLYTGIFREVVSSGTVRWKVYQEACSQKLGEPSYYPDHENPYLFLVWNLVNGEHYGRGLVEDYAGDFAKLSELSMALTLYEIEAMRLVNLSTSASGVDIDSFEKAETGETVQTTVPAGTNPGVWAYEGGNSQKIVAIQGDINLLEQKLSRAFMYSGNTRQGERVTAYEIRVNAQEAQNALGDSYSTLSDHWLTRLAYLYVLYQNPKMRPLFAMDATTLKVQVGTASLFKAAQADRLLEAAQSIQLIVPVLAQATKRINPDAVVDFILDSFGVVSDKLYYTEEQLKQQADQLARQQQQVQQQQQQLAAADPTVAGQQLGLIPS